MDPIEQFYADRAEAQAAQDPMAAVCCVASYDGAQVQQRTLVLRDVEGELAIFINATSPKWATLQDAFSLTTWWPRAGNCALTAPKEWIGSIICNNRKAAVSKAVTRC